MRTGEIQPVSLVSSNILENKFEGAVVDTWTVGGSWNIGGKVVYKATEPHTVFESLIDGNSGNIPPGNLAQWKEVGSSDRWAMFDPYVDTLSINADSIVDVVDTSGCNCLLVMGAYGSKITVSVSDGSVFYTETVGLVRDNVTDMYSYLFGPVRIGRDLAFYFESKGSSSATVTITHTGFTAKCGMCFPVVVAQLGWTAYGVKLGIVDYSKRKKNPYGNYYFNRGSWAKRGIAIVELDRTEIDYIYHQTSAQTGKAAFYDFNQYVADIESGHCSIDEYQSLLFYGFPESFDEQIPGIDTGVCGYTIQGLI